MMTKNIPLKKIVKSRTVNGEKQYLIKWKGFKGTTWQLAKDCLMILSETFIPQKRNREEGVYVHIEIHVFVDA